MRKPARDQSPRNRRTLRVLFVEDSPADALLMQRALERGGFECVPKVVDRAETLKAALEEREWDVILADHAMPHLSAPAALTIVAARGLDLPFLIVSGHIEEETAVSAMRAGAHDYVMKDNLARLVPAVERELREAEVRHARRLSEEALRQASETLEQRVKERTQELEEANVALQEALQERRRLENELLEIAENERRRIGLDLHDDLGQKLTGASLMLKGLEQKLRNSGHACWPEAQQIQVLLNGIISHTHNLAREFSALQLGGTDLPAVLRELAGNVEKMFRVPCRCAVTGAMPALPADALMQLQKIAQEAVSNAIKHGRATQVHIRLEATDARLVLTVENDGAPFQVPEKARARLGLRIMNYRASTIGGLLEIRAGDSSGTLVTCSLPVAKRSGRRGVETKQLTEAL